MSAISTSIPNISNLALEIMKNAIDENEKSQKITDEVSGPVALAAAMSDFFDIAGGIDESGQQPPEEAMTELADFTMDLFDRLASLLWHLDIHQHRDDMAALFISVTVWFARHNARLNNLKATADSFAILVNAENDEGKLAQLTGFIDEILESTSDTIQKDEDRSDPWRPWRVLNLNSGVAATRSLDAALMQEIFEKMEKRLAYELPGFFSDGKKQIDAQDVPQEVKDTMDKFAKKWPFFAIQ